MVIFTFMTESVINVLSEYVSVYHYHKLMFYHLLLIDFSFFFSLFF